MSLSPFQGKSHRLSASCSGFSMPQRRALVLKKEEQAENREECAIAPALMRIHSPHHPHGGTHEKDALDAGRGAAGGALAGPAPQRIGTGRKAHCPEDDGKPVFWRHGNKRPGRGNLSWRSRLRTILYSAQRPRIPADPLAWRGPVRAKLGIHTGRTGRLSGHPPPAGLAYLYHRSAPARAGRLYAGPPFRHGRSADDGPRKLRMERLPQRHLGSSRARDSVCRRPFSKRRRVH